MPKVVVIGAGIVGTSLADELTARGLHRRHRGRPRSAVHHRRIDLARTGPGVPDQPVQDDDRLRALHRREVLRSRAIPTAGRSMRSAVSRSRPPRSAGRTCTARRAGPRRGASTVDCSPRPNAPRCIRCSIATASSVDSTRPATGWPRRCVPAKPRRGRRSPAVRRSGRTPRCSASSRAAAASPACRPPTA